MNLAIVLIELVLVVSWASKCATSSITRRAPSALVVSASEYFEGNDGPWSTFHLRVGDPQQSVRVLVSTASSESMVVLSQYGCSKSVFKDSVPSDCAVSRGSLFNPNESSSYHDLGLYGINQNGVGLGANLGYSQRAQFGLDTVGVGLTGERLKNQTVAGIATPDPFYLGVFGLNPQPVNFTSLGNFSSPSFVTSLKDQGVIPSLSWSYTAGAKYRLKQVNGQLIFSGYDTSRFTSNSVSFTMQDDTTRDLVLYVQSISYSGKSSDILLSDPISVFVDSTDPSLWLPKKVCDTFEKAFGLTLDDESGLYLVNETQNTELLNSNAEVAFRLSDVSTGGETVTITLPYSAFALKAEPPLVKKSSHYFPLKRADNSSQYTLGRAFLQEAYLSADYERRTFNVSSCKWDEGAEENVVDILSKDAHSSSSDGSSSDGSNGPSGLSKGAVAGIAVGSVVGAVLLAALLFFFIRRHRQKVANKAIPPETDQAVLSGPVHNAPPGYSSSHASQSAMQPPFWSADAPLVSDSNNGDTSNSGVTHEQSVDDRGLELEGRDNQIKPVYHELPGTQVIGPTGPDSVVRA